MDFPSEIPVMIIPEAVLFPRETLPLYIFEPRYRAMLDDVLETHRMFGVAQWQPGELSEQPASVAGVGLVRASVKREDGTSHVMLQGLGRFHLQEPVEDKSYPVYKIQPMETVSPSEVTVDALMLKIRELAAERITQGFQCGPSLMHQLEESSPSKVENIIEESLSRLRRQLDEEEDPERLVDTVACAFVPHAVNKQIILETADLKCRMDCVISCLIDEINERNEDADDECEC